MTVADTIPPLSLHLRPGAISLDAAAAWLLPAGDVAQWLDEILRWQVPLAGVRLLPLPVSPRDTTTAGMLIFSDVQPTVAAAGRALPYRLLAPGVYAPFGSVLTPPVSPAELAERVIWPVAVFHPGLGLIGCRREDLIAAIDLIDAPSPRATDWTPAVRGVVLDRRTDSISPIAVITSADTFLDTLRDDVGQSSPDDIPELPQESPARRLIDQAKRGLTRAIGGVAGSLGENSAAFRALAEWANSRTAELTAGLDAARAKELARLMNLLDADPDQGLRYALPLQGGSHRGTAPPSTRLGSRAPTFSLAGLFSSGAGDAWDIQADVQQRLRRRYRELAVREMGLRRYGRAAYVFANLLGDYSAAANALEQGQLWREAATIYRDKLQDLRRAAVCLEKGGLVHEAIVIYLTLNQHTKIGDLYTLIGCPEEAASAYRASVQSHLAQDDLLTAADLLENKLAAPDEALAALTDAWPASGQAAACLRESFALLARLDRHDEAVRRMESIRAGARNQPLAFRLADVTADVATTYPAGPVRLAAEDATRLLAGHAMAGATEAQADSLLATVNRANGNDSLLKRDTATYLSGFSQAALRQKASPASSDRSPKVVRTFELGSAQPWRSFAAVRGGYVAMGAAGDDVVIARGIWDGLPQKVKIHQPDIASIPLRIFTARMDIRLYAVGVLLYFERVVVPAAGLPMASVVSATLDNASIGLGVAASPEGHIHWIGRMDNDAQRPLTCKTFNANGQLIDTADTDVIVPADTPPESIHFLAQVDAQVLTAGHSLYLLRKDRPAVVVQFQDQVVRMAGDLSALAAVRVTIDFEEGSAIVWPLGGTVERFARELTYPVTRQLADGTIISISGSDGRVFRLEDRRPQKKASFQLAPGTVDLAITSTAGQFATLNGTGRVTIYQLR